MNLDVNQIVKKGGRSGTFFEFVRQRLPAAAGFILVPDVGDRSAFPREEWLASAVVSALVSDCRKTPDQVYFKPVLPGSGEQDNRFGQAVGCYFSAVNACLILMVPGKEDNSLAETMLLLLGEGYAGTMALEKQEALLESSRDRFEKEKQVLKENNRDILERNIRQHEEHARTLESEIRKQTKDLVDARHAAESASRAKSEFLANMSHEIRTPLNGVIGMLEILSETQLSRTQASYVESTRQSAHSLLILINDILDFSKVEAGKLEIEHIGFNLATAMDALLDTIGPKAVEKGLDLVLLIEPEVPVHVKGDPSRIRQILINLAGNAVKFTDTGYVFIRISCENCGDDKCRLLFRVMDTGIGIPPDKVGKLFDLFSQVDSSTTRKFGGTGLGLAISRQLSRLMGGDIGVVSDLDKGSRFWFTVEVEREKSGAEDIHFPALAPLNVLVADNSRIYHKLYTSYMADFNCRLTLVSTAEDARDALEAAGNKGQPFDIFFADLKLPDRSGYLLCKSVVEQFPVTTPVLVLPGQIPDAEQKYKEFAAHFLFKPVKKKDLFLCLHLISSQAEDTAEERVTEKPPVPAESGKSPPARPLSILLAEDNPVNQRVAKIMLKGAGHRVTMAENGREAVALFRKNTFDIILMDIQMPVMDGEEACRRIRKLERKGDRCTPIIALTANAMKGHKEHYLSLGMDSYLSKPVKKNALLSMVEALGIVEKPF